MKTASKVFLILTLIGSLIGLAWAILGWGSFVNIIAEVVAAEEGIRLSASQLAQVKDLVAPYQIMMIIAFAVPTIVSMIGLNKLKNARYKSELIGIGIVTILFANLLAGIFMLCIRDEDL